MSIESLYNNYLSNIISKHKYIRESYKNKKLFSKFKNFYVVQMYGKLQLQIKKLFLKF